MELVERIVSKRVRVAVIGLGYVGLPLAVRCAEVGFSVVGIDVDEETCSRVLSGTSHIQDVADKALQRVLEAERLTATASFDAASSANAILICVPTPLTVNRQPEMRYIQSAIESLVPHLREGQLMVLESTTYPGTTEELLLPAIQARGFEIGKDFYLAFSPERVDPGNRTYKTHNTPKVVGGVTPACCKVAQAFYEMVIDGGVHTVSSPRVAEMTKLLENIFRAVNISLVNELALLCQRMGMDVWEVIDAAKTKPFGFMPFYPGPGLGGHCIPLDPFYLSWKAKEYGFTTRFIELAGEINDAMPQHVADRISELLNAQAKPLKGSKVLLLGVAYKKDISDTRESPALRVASELVGRGAEVSYYDPLAQVDELGLTLTRCKTLSAEAIAEQDVVAITADHSDIDYHLVATHANILLDTRGISRFLGIDQVTRLGGPLNPGAGEGS